MDKRMHIFFSMVLLLTAISPCKTQSSPAQIILIRHAEKPVSEHDVHLSERGRARANALVSLFATNKILNAFDTPVALFAAKPTRSHPSERPYETLEPLAKHLKLPIQMPFSSRDYAALASVVLNNPTYKNKSVVICWVHDEIPDLCIALGVKVKQSQWKSEVYDRCFVITYPKKKAKLSNIPQKLLPGDSSE